MSFHTLLGMLHVNVRVVLPVCDVRAVRAVRAGHAVTCVMYSACVLRFHVRVMLWILRVHAVQRMLGATCDPAEYQWWWCCTSPAVCTARVADVPQADVW